MLAAERILRETFTIRNRNPALAAFSIGISGYRENDTLQSMLLRADDALYTAKSKGRGWIAVEKAGNGSDLPGSVHG